MIERMSKTLSAEPQAIVDDAVLDAARALVRPDRRTLLGIVGGPAAGKSTACAALVAALGATAVGVPMDGFHLSQRVLAALGRSERKGAPDTFDANGYSALLSRIRHAPGTADTVYAPDFDRGLEEPVAARIAVAPDVALVVTEGNYLLLDEAPWPEVRARLNAVWSIDIDDAQRNAWLLARHMKHGRSEAEARAWIADSDAPNAARIAARAHHADRHLTWRGARLCFA